MNAPPGGALREGSPAASGGLRLWLGAALAVAVVAGVEWTLGWARVLRPWGELAPAALGAALALAAASHLARAARVHAYFRERTRGRFATTLRLVLVNTFFNNLLPMRLGEASFPLLLRRDFQVPLVSGTTALVWLRLMDLHTLLALGILGVGATLLAPAALAALLLGWLALPWLAYRHRGLLDRPADGPWGRRLAEAAAGLPRSVGVFALCWLWTGAAWGLKLAVFVGLLAAFSGAPLAPAVLGAVGGELTSVLPVHGLAGLGSYEAGVVAGMAPLGVAVEAAVTGALNLHLFLLAVSLLGGILALFLGGRRDPG